MNKALKVRIYPTENQRILIEKTFGCCRLIFNCYLFERYKFFNEHILPFKDKLPKEKLLEIYKSQKLTSEKERKVEFPFLKEVSSVALQQARQDCFTAFKNYFDSKSGKRKGEKVGKPKYKKKHNSFQSYRDLNINGTNLQIFYDDKTIKVPKLGLVRFRNRNKPKWFKHIIKLCNITIERKADRYYAVLCFEVKDVKIKVKKQRKEAIGLDFSPSNLYADSEGKTGKDYGYVAYKQENLKRLKFLERRLARKKQGSSNWYKAKIKLNHFEDHIANQRLDFQEKESLRLVRSYNKIVVENLNLKGISKYLSNAKNMNDTAYGSFVSKLEWKAYKYKVEFVKADRYFPSSQLCSSCGFQNKNLTLNDRDWICPKCGVHHNRDFNAAINLRNYIPWEARKSTSVDIKTSGRGKQSFRC